MNELLNNFRLEAGISQIASDPRLVVIDREGAVIDPLIGLEKFAELIVQECAQVCLSQRDPANLNYKPSERFAEAVKQHFGVEQ